MRFQQFTGLADGLIRALPHGALMRDGDGQGLTVGQREVVIGPGRTGGLGVPIGDSASQNAHEPVSVRQS